MGVKIIGRKDIKATSEKISSVHFVIGKNFDNHNVGKNDKEPGAVTQRLVTITRRDSR